MALLPIITIPDKRLRKVSAPVAEVTDELRVLAKDMLATMYDAPGVGLAAIQVGAPIRLLVIDASNKEDAPPNPMILFNPEIIESSEETNLYEEGCLSVPEYFAEVERPLTCTVRYLNEHNEEKQLECTEFLATVIQHEMDHLEGKMFIDYISKLKRDRVVKKLTKRAKEQANV